MSQQRKFFPGWFVVASGFVIMATCYTIFVNCMSLFQPLIVSDLGISLAQYNISNAISTVVSVVGSLVIGHVADKVSGRILGSLTVVATSAVLVGMSFVGELWQVYVLFAVSGCFAVASTRLLISLVTANWFTAKRGLAISIALSGSGFGGAILSPIVSSLIVNVGWRSAFLVLAAVCIVAALPITAYSFRTKPSDIGLRPLGENPGDPSASTAGDKDEHTAPEVSVGWSRIKKSSAFWLLVVAFLFMVVLCLLEIKLPEVVTTVTGFGAAANTFLCMIMIGESINLSVTFKDLLYILKILAVRLVIQVGLALFFWYCLPWDYDVRRALVLVAFAPVPAMNLIYTAALEGDLGKAANLNSLSVAMAIICMSTAIYLM